MTEVWLRGPLDGISPVLMPVAHALMQAREDLHRVAAGMTLDELRRRPGAAASVGFHLRHIAGSIDRLLTYARGRQLEPRQLDEARAEARVEGADVTAADLLDEVDAAIERALGFLRATRDDDLFASREVGRARLPSNVLGLLFHIAEHTQRHTGQTITTCMIVRSPGHATEELEATQ